MKDDIIKLLDLEDSDLVVEGPVVSKGKKILTLSRQLKPVYCPVCGSPSGYDFCGRCGSPKPVAGPAPQNIQQGMPQI